MTRKFFSAGISLLCFALILCALAATLSMQLLGDLKTYVEISLKNIERTTGYRITLEDIGWGIFEGGGIRVDNLVLYDSAGTVPLLRCKSAHIKFDILPIFEAKLIISRIALDSPRITVRRDGAGRWALPPAALPAPAGSISDADAFSDFSIALKRFTITDGTVDLDDRFRNVKLSLTDIELQLLRDRKSDTFGLTVSALQPSARGGTAGFTGVFKGFDVQGRPHHMSGSGRLRLSSFTLPPLASYLYDNATTAAEFPAPVSAELMVRIEPEWAFFLEGTAASDNMSIPLPGGTLLPLGKSRMEFSARRDGTMVLLKNFSLTCRDNATLAGTGSFGPLGSPSAAVDLQFSSNRISVPYLVRLAEAADALPRLAADFLTTITGGEIMATDAHLKAGFGAGTGKKPPQLAGSLRMFGLRLKFSPRLPALSIPLVQAQLFDNETVEAAISARWGKTDNHTLNVLAEAVFHEPLLTMDADSSLQAADVMTILSAAAPGIAAKITMPAGRITARTRVTYARRWDISSDIDFGQTAMGATGIVTKPEGVAFRLKLKTAPAHDNAGPSPLAFTVSGGEPLRIEGTINSWDPFMCSGSYRAENFNLARIEIFDLKGLVDVTGTVSGRGSFRIPAGAGEFPVQGTCSLKNVAAVAAENDMLLFGGSLDGVFENSAFTITTCRAAAGATEGTLSGKLTTVVPPRGILMIVADLFDIDDFVRVIDTYIAVNTQLKKRNAPPGDTPGDTSGMLQQIDLDMPLQLKRMNLWNWDFDNGTCLWTLKEGMMRFDNITISGGGPINGKVLFDLSRLPVRTLRLEPSRSRSDFLFVVPALRKNRTITGTLDMRGWFSSTFSRKEELGSNMAGEFHIDLMDGKIQKLTIISKILELMNLGNFFSFVSSDIFSTGMPYDTITADFTVDHAVMKTENLQLKGPAMNLSAVGTIDMRSEEMDLVIGAQILEAFGKFVGAIPIAGGIVTGKDKTITLAYFKASGSYQDAAVKPMPVKSLGSPIKKIIDSLLYFPKKLMHAAPEPVEAAADNSTL